MTLADRFLEAIYRQRKITNVDITRLTITVTWGALDDMDDGDVKKFPVTDDLAHLVHVYLSRGATPAEKKSAKDKILKKIL